MVSAIALTPAEIHHVVVRNVLPRLGTLKRERVFFDAHWRRRRTGLALEAARLDKKLGAGKSVIDHPIGKKADLWSKCFPQRLVVAVVAARAR
jgi:shikimate 5-dehydrogenase